MDSLDIADHTTTSARAGSATVAPKNAPSIVEPCSWGVAVMTTTLVFSLIAALLTAGVIADSLWGRRFWR